MVSNPPHSSSLPSSLLLRSESGNLCQWFYFAVFNAVPGVSYKFNVVNFKKKVGERIRCGVGEGGDVGG